MAGLASINIRIRALLDQFSTDMQNANRQIAKMGKQMNKVGKSLSLGLTAPLTGFGIVASKTFMDFEQQMAKVKAISGATGPSFLALEKSALDLGAATKYTSSQVAELQLNYSKLGFSPDEIVQVTAATLNLASATGSDLAESALVAASTLRGFGLEVTQMERVVDVMASSFSSSALDLEKFQVAMATLAPVAKNAGVSLEEATSYLAILVDRGVDATTAATGLRNIFLDLAGTGRTLKSAMSEIAQATNKNKVAFDLFGKRGATVASIMADNSAEAKKLEDSFINSSGAALSMARIMGQTAYGSVLRMKSAIEAVAISFGNQMAPSIKSVADTIAEIAKKFNSLSSETKKFIVILSGIAAATGPLLVLAGTVLPAISAGLVALTGPVGLAVAALAGVAVVIAKNWEPIKELLVSISNYFVDLYNESTAFRISVEGISLAFKNMYAIVKNILENLYTLITAVVKQIAVMFESFGDVLKGALTLDTTLIKKGVTDLLTSTKANFSNTILGIKENFNDTFKEVTENLKTALDNSLKRSKYVLPVTLKVKNPATSAIQQEGQPSMSTAANQDIIVLKPEIAWDQAFQDQEELNNLFNQQIQWEKFFDNEAIAKENERMENLFNQTVQKMQAFKQKALAIGIGLGDVFSSIGNSIVDSFNLASHGLQGFIKELLKTTVELIRMQLANSMANSISGATASGAATGPAAIFTTPAFIAKALAGVAAAFATLPKFAESGVVGGSSFSGDKILARLNSGELVLNQKHQNRLLSMISGNSRKLNLTVDVNGVISGTDLKLVLDRTTIREDRLE